MRLPIFIALIFPQGSTLKEAKSYKQDFKVAVNWLIDYYFFEITFLLQRKKPAKIVIFYLWKHWSSVNNFFFLRNSKEKTLSKET